MNDMQKENALKENHLMGTIRPAGWAVDLPLLGRVGIRRISNSRMSKAGGLAKDDLLQYIDRDGVEAYMFAGGFAEFEFANRSISSELLSLRP